MSPTFSVITPSYNQGQFIERTIQSVLAQGTLTQDVVAVARSPQEDIAAQSTGVTAVASEVILDYIVCDGGSTDNTVDILKQYQTQLRWVSEPDGGQADAVNKGIAATRGEIIAWINSDDIYYAGALRKVGKIFESHPDVQVVYGNANNIDLVDNVIEPYPSEPWNYTRLKETCFISQPATFFRRRLVEKWGDLNSCLQFCMDYELWLRYGAHTRFYYLPEILAGSRIYQNTKTLGQRTAVHYEINEMLKEKFAISPEKWVLSYASIVAEEQVIAQKKDANPSSKSDQMSVFLREAVRGYSRWRGYRISFSTLWVLFKMIALSTYRRVHTFISSL